MARIKGTAMVNVIKSLRSLGKDEVRQRVPPPLHGYLHERILPSSWYPEEDHLELIRALGDLLQSAQPEIGEDVFSWMGRSSAKTDVSTVYASLVAGSTPESALRRGSALWRSYHDTGSLEVTILGPGKARLELIGYGLPSTEMCRVFSGWVSGLLHAGGAQQSHLVERECRNHGRTTCVWEADWS